MNNKKNQLKSEAMKITKRIEQIGGKCHQSLCIIDKDRSLIFRTYGLEDEYLEMIQVRGMKEIVPSTPASIDDALNVLSKIHLLSGEYIHRLISPNEHFEEVKEDPALYSCLPNAFEVLVV